MFPIPSDRLPPGVFVLESGLPGPTVAIFGGVHGNETCGVRLVDELRAGFIPKRGTLVLAYGNPEAVARGVRQVGANLNRMFRPDSDVSPASRAAPEFARSRGLMSVLEKCDALLDLHSSPTADGFPFAIGEKPADPILRKFPCPVRISGFNAVEPGGTDGYMFRAGKLGMCVECGQHADPAAVDVARSCAREFLAHFGMADGAGGTPMVQDAYEAFFAYVTRTADFRIAKNFRDFEDVAAGQIIGTDGDVPATAPTGGKILFATDRDLPGVEGFVMIRTESE